jgi:serine/threonine protein kinase
MAMIVEDLTLLERIGKGSFGEVYLTKKAGTSHLFATKKVAKNLVMQQKIKRYFNNEIYILKNMDHPNVIRLYEIKQTINNFYLVFDYCNGGGLSNCLEAHMKKFGKPFSEEVLQSVMRKVVSGLHYLHKNKIMHRDLKLDNILVHFNSDEDKKSLNMLNTDVKIIDFGFARYLQDDELAQSVLGSPITMDPQILQKLKKIDSKETFGYDEKADIWSLGTIAYELLIGVPPFDANSYDELLEKISKGVYTIPNSLKLSKQCISFLNGLLQHDPKQRLGVDDLLFHEFLTMEVSKFEKVDLTKLSKSSNTKELIMSTKDNKNLWYLFETPGADNDSLNISGKTYADAKKNNFLPKNNYNQALVKGKEEDYLGSLIEGVRDIVFNNTGNYKLLKLDPKKGDYNTEYSKKEEPPLQYQNPDLIKFEPVNTARIIQKEEDMAITRPASSNTGNIIV